MNRLGFADHRGRAFTGLHDHGAAQPSALPAGVNPVQNEMRVLHEASRD